MSEKKKKAKSHFFLILFIFILAGLVIAPGIKVLVEKGRTAEDFDKQLISAESRPQVSSNIREEEKDTEPKGPSLREQYMDMEKAEQTPALPAKDPDKQDESSEDKITDETTSKEDEYTGEVTNQPENQPSQSEPTGDNEKISGEVTTPERQKENEDTAKKDTAKNIPKEKTPKSTSYTLKSGTYTGGINVEPGIYNVEAISGDGTFQAGQISDEGFIGTLSAEVIENKKTNSSFQGIIIKKDTDIQVMNNLSVKLTKVKDLPYENE